MAPTRGTTILAGELEEALVAVWTSLLRRGEQDLSRTSAAVLAMLLERPRRVTELAAAQAVAQPTMTVAVKRLEARGLVRRARAADDGRAVDVVITDAGRALLAARQAARAALLAERLDALDADARDALSAALPALRALCLPEHPTPHGV